jgi:hypothetical protein
MATQLDGQEIAALEYLVSGACDFMVEMRQDSPDRYYFRPATHPAATALGDYQRGQRFWSSFDERSYDSPFEAAVMFVNAVRTWARKSPAPVQHIGEQVH